MTRDLFTSFGLLILRVSVGLSMLLGHGWDKVVNFSERAATFPDPIGLGSQLSLIGAIAAEVGCSVLIIFGIVTRLAAIPLAFTMIVALLVIHAGDPWKTKELAAMYLTVYATLILAGGGRFAVERFIQRRRG